MTINEWIETQNKDRIKDSDEILIRSVIRIYIKNREKIVNSTLLTTAH